MTSGTAGSRSFIWATRGKTWGFRFLRRGGSPDALRLYEEAFSDLGDATEACRKVGDRVALRFPDPDGRRDASGRVITHDFVLFGAWVTEVDSLDAGRQRVWREIRDEFARIWDKAEPPSEEP